MQIVIDIPEKEYNTILNNNYVAVCACPHLLSKTIKNGTPLPKGHGRLIDADMLADRLEKLRDGWNYYGNGYENGFYKGYDYSLDEVIDAPTIIECEEIENTYVSTVDLNELDEIDDCMDIGR